MKKILLVELSSWNKKKGCMYKKNLHIDHENTFSLYIQYTNNYMCVLNSTKEQVFLPFMVRIKLFLDWSISRILQKNSSYTLVFAITVEGGLMK